jgi:UDP-glucose 4-epimerase
MIELVEKVTEKEIPYKIVSRRAGDIDTSIANAQKAKQVLGREYSRSMYQAIEDAWRFIQKINS